jgi:hypothetical protein
VTYRVGDDIREIYPVTDTADPPGNLSFDPVVKAWQSDGTTVEVPGAQWLGAAGSTRDLEVPLASLPAGLWGLGLTVDGGADLFLGNVYIE